MGSLNQSLPFMLIYKLLKQQNSWWLPVTEGKKEKGKAEEAAEKTGEAVGKGVKKGVGVVKSLGKGLAKGIKGEEEKEEK